MTGLRADLHPFRLALRAPLVSGVVPIRFRAGFLVSLTADGLTGWGEASPLPGWSRTSLLETEAGLRRVLDGLDACDESGLGTLIGTMQDTPHARAGVAGAWADLQARRAGRSLADHLVIDPNRVPAQAVAVNALIAEPEPSRVEEAVRNAADAGFRAVKLKVGAADPAIDVERVRAARAALGDEAELRLDANGAWDERTALEVLERVDDSDIAYCEEPVAGVEEIAALGQRSPVPVAVDESIRSEADAVKALNLGVSTLIVKPQALGGPDIALAIAERARRAGASVVVTSFLDTTVGVSHALHVAAAVAGTASPRRAHGLATSNLLAGDVADSPPVTSGEMQLPRSPGIGVVPDAEPRPAASGAVDLAQT